VFSNYGTYPSWSPYQGDVIRQAITFEQNNTFTDNTYTGSWTFLAFDPAQELTFTQWSTAPYYQDSRHDLLRSPRFRFCDLRRVDPNPCIN
jgi:hypothetical protein